jgi:hypothetical protein
MSKVAKQWADALIIPDGVMKPVLQELAYRHMAGEPLFPSQQTLAFSTGNSDRAVREALRLLEHFGIITRRARSNGAGGRSSDKFELLLEQQFTLTKVAISTARRALRNRNVVPVAESSSQPERGSGGAGTTFRGIGDLGDSVPSKDHYRGNSELEGGPKRPNLRLVVGGDS